MLDIRKNAWLAVLLLAVVAWPTSAAEEKSAAGGKPGLQGAFPRAPAAAEADRFTVPDGTPQQLVAYINTLMAGPIPRDAATITKMRKAILDAAEKILASKPTAQEMEFAVRAKMNTLSSREQLVDFAGELSKGGHEKFARQIRGFMLQIDLRKAAAGNGPTRKRIAEALKFLQEASPQPSDVTLAYTTGQLAEMSDDREFASKTYEAMVKVFAASKNPKLAEFATVLQGVVRRLNLVGQEMKIEGKVLDGAAFDWSKFRGKVVAVEFWASPYPSCLREIRDLKQYYDQYHAKGLEIVGVSLDRKLANVREFIKANAIPWTTVVDESKPNPTIAYYGVMNLPTTILVGRDGRVVAIDLRGEAIGKELEKLLGPMEKEAEPAATPEAKKN